jgi:hypothetical protein
MVCAAGIEIPAARLTTRAGHRPGFEVVRRASAPVSSRRSRRRSPLVAAILKSKPQIGQLGKKMSVFLEITGL